MSQQYNIKWRVEDEKELRRVARNFNDKLRRLVKKSPENQNIYPQFYNQNTQEFESRVTIAGLKEVIDTRKDYNRVLNMLKRFSERGAEAIIDAPGNEYGTRTTKWQRAESARLAGIVNRKRQERLDLLNTVEMVDVQGKLGYTLGQRFGMDLASRNTLKPTKAFTPSKTQTDLKYKWRALMDESRTFYHKDRDQLLKENYIKTLKQNYKEADITDVIARINGMDMDAFILKFEAKGDAFEFAYPPDKEQYDAYLSELKGYWTSKTSILDIAPEITSTMLAQ